MIDALVTVGTGLLSGAFAFGGALMGVRKDISWLTRWLERHDKELSELRDRNH